MSYHQKLQHSGLWSNTQAHTSRMECIILLLSSVDSTGLGNINVNISFLSNRMIKSQNVHRMQKHSHISYIHLMSKILLYIVSSKTWKNGNIVILL